MSKSGTAHGVPTDEPDSPLAVGALDRAAAGESAPVHLGGERAAVPLRHLHEGAGEGRMMPVKRIALSVSQFCDCLALEPGSLVGVEIDRRSSRVVLILEPTEDDMAPRELGPSWVRAAVGR
jgi:hypothetical protein